MNSQLLLDRLEAKARLAATLIQYDVQYIPGEVEEQDMFQASFPSLGFMGPPCYGLS